MKFGNAYFEESDAKGVVGSILVGWCCMSCHSGETVNHPLLCCDVAQALWSEVFQMFGIQWVMPSSVADLLFGWRNWFGKHLLMHKNRYRYWYDMGMGMIQHF